ncbi:MAG: glycosyltransferase [Eggerthellaceae bacterium]|nr:glycosyltransferase [Eggerthellaceae bacterium]
MKVSLKPANADLSGLLLGPGAQAGLNKGVQFDGSFTAVEDDSWFEVCFEVPSRYVVFYASAPGGYTGDSLTVYFAEEGEPFSQDLTWHLFEFAGAGVIRLFSFDEPVAKVRLDLCEVPGRTGVEEIGVVGLGDLGQAQQLTRTLLRKKPALDFAPILVTRRDERTRYQDWFNRRKASPEDLACQAKTSFGYEPLVSLVVPLYHTDTNHLGEMVRSVLAQSYGKWELVLVNSTPDDEPLSRTIDELRARDARIKVVQLDQNYGIAGNTNRGIAASSGEFVGFLDHDDFIEPDLLYCYVETINGHDAVDALYCDEDKYDPVRGFIDPRLKPGFNLGLLRNNNYICHLFMVRKSLLDDIGPIPSGFDGAQDHWLILRVAELTRAIASIDRVLYHWRITELSTAGGEQNKPYAVQAGIGAVQDHCARTGVPADVEGYRRPFTYRVDYRVKRPCSVSVVVPPDYSPDQVRSIVETAWHEGSGISLELVLLDDGDGRGASVIPGLPPGVKAAPFSLGRKGCMTLSVLRRLARALASDYVAVLPRETCVAEGDWLQPLLSQGQRPEVALAGGRVVSSDGATKVLWLASDLINAGKVMGILGETGVPSHWFFSPEDTQDVELMDSVQFLMARDILLELLDGVFLFGCHQEPLPFLCRKSREKGHVNAYAADSVLRVVDCGIPPGFSGSSGTCAPEGRFLAGVCERNVNPNIGAIAMGNG